MRMYYLYRIVNTVNNKEYYGITYRPKERMQQHFYRSGYEESLVKRAVKKYGVENFSFTVLCAGSKEYIIELETKAILEFKSITPLGYNIRFESEYADGLDYSIQYRNDDEFNYCCGFWFPNTRTTLRVLGIEKKTFYIWKKQGTLGDTVRIKDNSISDKPQYVAGFWWPHLYIASEILNLSVKALRIRVKRGQVEEKSRREERATENLLNWHSLKIKPSHAKQVEILGVVYPSLKDAGELSEYSVSKIRTRINNGTEGFRFLN